MILIAVVVIASLLVGFLAGWAWSVHRTHVPVSLDHPDEERATIHIYTLPPFTGATVQATTSQWYGTNLIINGTTFTLVNGITRQITLMGDRPDE